MSCYPLFGVWLLDKDRSLLYDLARHGLTIKGGSLDLSAPGGSTIVTVTSEATVTTAITADDGATVIVDENATTTGATQNDNEGAGTITSVDLSSVVAYIGGNTYTTLDAAFEAVKTGETIVLQKDITQDAGFKYDKTGVSAELNLNGYTVTVNTGANVNNRAFKINNGTLEVYGGSIVAVGSGTTSSNGAGCYGAFRVEAGGVLNAHDLELTNSRPWGLNVKVLGGTAELTNVKITSSYGGGIEVTEADLGTHSQGGTATLTNCTFTQTGYFDHCSTALSVSGGSELIINSGSYTSDNYALYVFSSGGIITVKDGTFSGNKDGVAIVAAIDTNTYPQYTGGLQLEGGNYTGGFNITSPASLSITGGTYSVDPTAYLASGYTTSGSNPWTVIKREGAVFNLTELQAAISNGVTPIYYAGEAITEAFTLAPAAATVINGLKVNHLPATVTSDTVTLTINGDVTLNDAEITTKAYCGISVSEGKKVTLKDCVVDGSSATASDSRAMNINGGAVVTIDGSTIKGPATAGYSRCLNILGDGAKVDVINGSTLSVSHYAVNMPSSTVNAVVNVKNSSVNTGWAISNIWKTDNTVNFEACTLNSLNDKGYHTSNAFSAFVFNTTSSGNKVTVKDCAVSVRSTTGNFQTLVSLRNSGDAISFIGKNTISLEDEALNQVIDPANLGKVNDNTLTFDAGNLAQVQEYLDPCLVANGPVDDLYTVSFAATVRAYNGSAWTYYLGLKDALADATNVQINFIDNVVLAEDIVPAQNANGYILIVNGNYTVTTNNHVVKLPADYLVIAQNPINGLFSALDDSYEVSVVDVAVGDETWTGYVAQSAAQIGDLKYATVKDAIEAANGMDDDATITLVSDVTEAECWTATKSMTLDLNGHTYINTATANIPASYTGTHSSYKASMMFAPKGNGTFTVDATSGGKIVVNPAAADAIGFLVSDDVKTPEYTNKEIQFVVKGKSSSDTVFEFDGNVKYGVLACYRNPSSVLSVKDAKIVSTKTTAYGVTVYLEQIGKVDMNSVCIRSSFPECVCVGDSMHNEEENRATGTFKNCDFAQTGTGTDWTNVAINMSSNALVEVYSGTYSGNGAALSVASSGGTAKLYGGTFNGKTRRFITTGTSGYSWAKTAIYYDPSSCDFTGSTEDTVVGSDIVAPFVAQIGETKYATLAEAIAAANATGNVTIKLLKDYDFEASEPGYGYTTDFVAEGETTTRNNMLVFSGNNITFDLGNHTISNLFNNTFKVAGTGIVFQNGEMRVGQLYYASKNSPSTPYTTENERTCSYIVYVREATNFTVNNLTTYGGINVSASTATINNLSFSGTKFYAVCSQSSATVTLNGGTYTKAITGATGNLFWIETGSVMNIIGGTYIKGNASFRSGVNPVITGGVFDFNPTNFGVKEGYVATETGTGTWTVQEKQTIEGTGQGSTGGTPGAGTDPQFP